MFTPTGVHGGVMYCKYEHPLTESNRRWRTDLRRQNGGYWVCRICEKNRQVSRNKPEYKKTLRNASKGKFCNHGHALEGDNMMWHKDARREAGGFYTCKTCFRTNASKRQANYRKRKARQEQFTYVGPREMIAEVAQQIVDSALEKTEAEKLVTLKAGLVAHARLMRRPTSEPATAEQFEAEFARSSDEMWKAVDRLMAAEKKNPLAHLNVKPDAERAWDRFNKALEEARLTGENVPNCQDRPAEFVDYDEDNLPTADEAYRLCHGDENTPKCPLLELCAVYAEQERPAWGVHGGEAWAYGEPVNNE